MTKTNPNHPPPGDRHEKRPRRPLHQNWLVWLGVILMLAAIVTYILTLNESVRAPVIPQAPVR